MKFIRVECDGRIYKTTDLVNGECILTGKEVTLTGMAFHEVSHQEVVERLQALVEKWLNIFVSP